MEQGIHRGDAVLSGLQVQGSNGCRQWLLYWPLQGPHSHRSAMTATETLKLIKKSYLPEIVMPNCDIFVPALLKIQSEYISGTPEDMTLIRDLDSLEVIGGEKFIMIYLNKKSIKE